MNLFTISVISSFSIGIAAITGLVRHKRIDESYQPFIVICWVSLLAETISLIFIYRFRNNAVPYNIYAITEAVLYVWLFKSWGEFENKPKTLISLVIFLGLVWVTDNFILNSFFSINPLFWIVYSFTLIFLSINQLNRILVTGRTSLLRDSRFLICMCIIIFYSYTATIEVFYILKLNFSDFFYNRVYLVLEIVNFIVNLIFAAAVVWIPRRQKFILPFS